MPQPTVPRTDELRLALVLNGGVSLAVWMGGVVFELNRLVRETHPVYRGLLELTGTAARIDVISGTSAGGVNGAALALAQLHDQGLYALRDVWIKTGGLDDLLQDPDAPDLRSMLRGDDYFLPNIRAAFADLVDPPRRAPPELVPLSLSLTSTLLDGVTHTSMDDFGADIEDRSHRALWRFPHLPSDDAFAHPRIVDQLAFAARATASFPVAFEPALHDPAGKAFAGAMQRLVLPDAEESRVDRKTYLMDGGILDNKPFDAALKAIARLPAEGNTRRVLAYIVPDPAASAEERKADDNGKLEAPTLAQAAWRSLVSIPATQSIATHMTELRSHNDTMSRRWRRLVGAIVHMGADGLMNSAGLSLHAYRSRRVDGMIDYFLERTEERLAGRKAELRALQERKSAERAQGRVPPGSAAAQDDSAEVYGMRRATRQWLASVWRATARPVVDAPMDRTVLQGGGREWPAGMGSIHQAWARRLPPSFAPGTTLFGAGQPWTWGVYALEFMAEFATEVLRRTQRLHSLVPRWRQQRGDGTAQDALPGPAIPVRENVDPPADDLATDRQTGSAARQTLLHEGTRLSERDLMTLWSEAYLLSAEIRKLRETDNQDVGAAGSEGFLEFLLTWKRRGGESPPEEDSLEMLEELLSVGAASDAHGRELAERLCRLLVGLRPHIDTVLGIHREGQGRIDIDEAVAELRAIAVFLFEPSELDAGQAAGEDGPEEVVRSFDRIAWRVLSLEVFEVAAGSRRRAPGVQAEVVQVSARLQSAFGGSADPAQKLNGMQLAHFGAFYKRSWRANDWTYGRLDGIDRAVRIALNPDALQKRFGYRRVTPAGSAQALDAAEYVRRYIHALAVTTAAQPLVAYLDELWKRDEAAIREELAWLDVPATVPPPVLEHCARALTRRLQLEALRQELPCIAECLQLEARTGAPPSATAGQPLLVKVAPTGTAVAPDPEDAVELLRDNLLGRETLALQVGTDQLTRTASKGLATAHTAMSSKSGGLASFSALNVIFKVTEWPLRILYWLAVRLSRGSRTEAAVSGLALGVGVAIVAAAMVSEKMSGEVLAFGWALLAGSVAVTLLRSRAWGLVLVACLLLVLLPLKPIFGVMAVVVAVVIVVLLQPWGGLAAMLLAIALALWWSAGASNDALALLWKDAVSLAEKVYPDGWAGHDRLAGYATQLAQAPAASASAAEQATADYGRLKSSLLPALAIMGLLIVVAIGRYVDRALAGPRQRLQSMFKRLAKALRRVVLRQE